MNRAASLIPVPLLLLLCLFPPETRGESMAGCAVLLALFLVLGWREARAPGMILAAAAVALPLAWAGSSPAAAVRPVAVMLLAAAAGLVAAGLAGRTERVRGVALALAAGGSWVSLHGIYQRLWGLERRAAEVALDPTLPDRHALLLRLEEGRAFASFSTPAALGGWLALSLPVTVALALGGSGRLRWLGWSAAALQLVGLALTGSATASAALVGAGAIAALVQGRRDRRAWIGAAAVGLVLLGVLFSRAETLLAPTDPTSPWRLRAGNFRSALAMARDHPWLGVGPGGFAENYPRYRRPGDNETRHAHNLPLEMLAESGWVAGPLAGGLFLVLFAGPLFTDRRSVEAGMAVGLAAFALHNLADYTAYMPSLLWSAAVLRGLIGRQRTADRPAPVLGPLAVTLGLAAALAAGLSGLGRDQRVAAREAAFAGEAGRAETLAQRATRLAPWDVDAALLLARTTPEDRSQQALQRAERAVALSPVRPASRQLRARLRLARGDYPGAYADLVAAVELYPLEPQYAADRDLLESRIRSLAPR